MTRLAEGGSPPRSVLEGSGRTGALELYRWAVQDPETHALVIRTMYDRVREGSRPLVLREDFAGTAAESVAWVALERGRRAVAVDLDPPTLDWAQRRAARLLGTRASEVSFVQGDALRVAPPRVPPADVISVLNFSICYQRERDELRRYLRNAFHGLAGDGILVLNLFGGAAAVEPGTTRSAVTPKPRLPAEAPVRTFEYEWEVRSWDPAARRIDCRIHFAVPDPTAPGGTRRIPDAFHYDWRLWSVRDLVEACAEAGFPDVQVWRHTYDPSKGAAGVFLGRVDPDDLPARGSWSVYILACR